MTRIYNVAMFAVWQRFRGEGTAPLPPPGQWRNVGGLARMAPLGGKKAPPGGAPWL